MGFENGRAHVLVRHAQNTKYERQNMQHMRNIYMFLIWKSSFACKKHKNNAWYDRPKSHFHVETHGIIFAKSQWSNQEIAKSLEDDPAHCSLKHFGIILKLGFSEDGYLNIFLLQLASI